MRESKMNYRIDDEDTPDPVQEELDLTPKRYPPSRLLNGLLHHAGIVKPKPLYNPFGFNIPTFNKKE
jgi:hypothetical protein